MRITKIFTAECAHIMANAHSTKCSESWHGHSYKIEVELEGHKLDHAGMLLDFNCLKGPVKEFIESFDHCTTINTYADEESIKFFQKHNERWMAFPYNCSAELMALTIHRYVQMIIDQFVYSNGEDPDIKVKSVTVHETATGRAQSSEEDIKTLWNEFWIPVTCFSNGVTKGWSKELKSVFFGDKQPIKFKKPKQHINIPGF